MQALLRRRLGTAASSEVVNVAKQWSTWTSIEAAQLNWMRNALSSTGLGLALIHFRRELDGAPPLGGLVLVALGLGYSYAGAAVYLTAAWQLRRTLGLSVASGAAVVGHALLAPCALTTAALCFADRTPAWVASVAERAVPGSKRKLDERRIHESEGRSGLPRWGRAASYRDDGDRKGPWPRQPQPTEGQR